MLKKYKKDTVYILGGYCEMPWETDNKKYSGNN